MIKEQVIYTPAGSEPGDDDSIELISRQNSVEDGKFNPPASIIGDEDDAARKAIVDAVKPHSDVLESSRQSSRNSKLPMLSLFLSGIGLTVSFIGAAQVQSLSNRIRELESSASTKNNITLHEIGPDQSALVVSASPDVQADAQTEQKLEDILEIIKKIHDDKETGKATVTDTVTVTVTADPPQATTTDVQALSTPFDLQEEMWKVLFDRLSSP